jgi:histone H2B
LYIKKIQKFIHVEQQLSINTIAIMDSFVNDFFERLAMQAATLARFAKRITLTERDIEAAVKLILPGSLSKHAVISGRAAHAKFKTSVQSNAHISSLSFEANMDRITASSFRL